jgi:integrase
MEGVMASIRRRGDRWQARVIRKGFEPEAKSFTSKQDAEKWARAIEREMDTGGYVSRSTAEATTLEQVLSRYRLEVTPLKRGSEVEAIRLKVMERHRMARRSLATITAATVAEYRDERLKVVSGPTVLRELQILSSVLNHARREWCFPIQNAVADVRRPAPGRGRNRTLDHEGESSLLAHLEGGGRSNDGTYMKGTRNPWVAPLVRLALETAMRRGELLALLWEHIDLTKRTAFLPLTKNGHTRTVTLSTNAVAVLSSLPRSIDGRVFPITANALKLAFVRACTSSGIVNLHFHDFRHHATSRLAERLPNVIELAMDTGHSDLRMLARYYHVKPEALALKLA